MTSMPAAKAQGDLGVRLRRGRDDDRVDRPRQNQGLKIGECPRPAAKHLLGAVRGGARIVRQHIADGA